MAKWDVHIAWNLQWHLRWKKRGESLWLDYHRKFLPQDHVFRINKNDFKIYKRVTNFPPPRLSPNEVWTRVCELSKFTDYGEACKIQGYGVKHNWTKRSIFWDLPYWKDNMLRHNLDVMHIENDFFDNVFNIVMDVQGKTKDNEKAKKDMEFLCN